MFDPSGSKDGNVAGRLEGFLKKLIKQYEMQYGPMPGPQASTAHSGSWHGAAKGGATSYRGDANMGGAGQSESLRMADPSVSAFMEKCGLDSSGAEYLESLPED